MLAGDWTNVGRRLDECWQATGRMLAGDWANVGRRLDECWQATGRMLAGDWTNVGRRLDECWQSKENSSMSLLKENGSLVTAEGE